MKKLICICLALVIGVGSALLAGDVFANPKTYEGTMGSIEQKVEKVLALVTSTTVASTAVSALPDDTATPVAEKLADLSQYFLLILCVLYTEKYLLTMAGWAAFRALIPAAAGIYIYSQLRNNPGTKQLAVKILLFALVLAFAIPISISLSDRVYDTYQVSIDATMAAADELTQETEALENAGLLEKLTRTVSDLTQKGAALLSNFLEALAVMIVTTCVIPVLGILIIIWLLKLFTGANLLPALPAHRSVAKTMLD